jgi:ubiquinone/menaquinone biosynthesis C-methylase UbiE
MASTISRHSNGRLLAADEFYSYVKKGEVMNSKPVAAGKSSFDLIDTEKTFEIIEVKPNSTFLDLACGIGKYSVKIAQNLGEKGVVYAVDLWQEGIEALKKEIERKSIKNIKTILADISKKLPLEENSIDSCLMATIIHDLSKSDQKSAIQEVFRLVKPGGMLNIIEFKKIEKGPGPPVAIRMGEEEIEALITPYGFYKIARNEVGEFNYLVQFKKIT